MGTKVYGDPVSKAQRMKVWAIYLLATGLVALYACKHDQEINQIPQVRQAVQWIGWGFICWGMVMWTWNTTELLR